MTDTRILTLILWAITILTFPIAWAIGYPDHPWKQAAWAIAFAFAATLTAVMFSSGIDVDPPPSRPMRLAAILVTVGTLATTLIWVWTDAPGHL